MRQLVFVWFLKSLRTWDRLRLRVRMTLQPGLEIHPDASSNFAAARFALAPGARLRIGAGAVTERIPGALQFDLEPGAVVELGERAWLRTAAGPVRVVAYEGAVVDLGHDCFLNAATVSAKAEVRIGAHCNLGLGSRVFDSDQHDFDAERPEVTAAVRIGAHTWLASDVTVLRGVSIGDHSVIGARSLVNRDIPAHTFAAGIPAKPRGEVGDRTHTR